MVRDKTVIKELKELGFTEAVCPEMDLDLNVLPSEAYKSMVLSRPKPDLEELEKTRQETEARRETARRKASEPRPLTLLSPLVSGSIVGRRIEKVIVARGTVGYDDTDNVSCDAGVVLLLLDDGLVLRFYNSEWGGIDVLDPVAVVAAYDLGDIRDIKSLKEAE